jgi:metacaspase-1
MKAGMGIFKVATGSPEKATQLARQTKSSPADAVRFYVHSTCVTAQPLPQISWSGCKDSQTSADATEAGKATGAMSYAFIKTMRM